MRSLTLLVACTLAGAAALAQPPLSLTSRDPLQQLAHEPTDERIQAYERLLQSSPDHVGNQLGLVGAYLQKLRESGDFGYLDRASKLVDRMLAKDSGNFAALRYQNEIDLQRHDFKTVAERAETLIADHPSDPGVWANLGDASMELGHYDRAGQAYIKMFSLRPGLGSYNRLAYWRFVTGDGTAAVQLMQSAVDAGDDVAENTAWCLAELGDMEFKLGKTAEAVQTYKAALNLFPRLHRALAGLGRTAAALGHRDDAVSYYKQAQAIVPMVEYAGALEDLYSAAGMSREAEQQRRLVAAIVTLGRATNEKTNRNLALVLADHKRDLEFALQLMTAEVPVRGDVYTWDALSWVLFQSGHLEQARAASVKATKLGTPEPLFRYHAQKIASAGLTAESGAR